MRITVGYGGPARGQVRKLLRVTGTVTLTDSESLTMPFKLGQISEPTIRTSELDTVTAQLRLAHAARLPGRPLEDHS